MFPFSEEKKEEEEREKEITQNHHFPPLIRKNSIDLSSLRIISLFIAPRSLSFFLVFPLAENNFFQLKLNPRCGLLNGGEFAVPHDFLLGIFCAAQMHRRVFWCFVCSVI
jgi:hypothetical protein